MYCFFKITHQWQTYLELLPSYIQFTSELKLTEPGKRQASFIFLVVQTRYSLDNIWFTQANILFCEHIILSLQDSNLSTQDKILPTQDNIVLHKLSCLDNLLSCPHIIILSTQLNQIP